MVASSAVLLVVLAAGGGGSLPEGCKVRPFQDFELVECADALGYAVVGRSEVYTPRGMESMFLAGFEPRLGKARGPSTEELRVGGSKATVDRYDFANSAGKTTGEAWFLSGQVGKQLRLSACLGKPGHATARDTCSRLFPAIERMKPSNLDDASKTVTTPTLRGRALKVPPGCEVRPGNAIRCPSTRTTLSVVEAKGRPIDVDAYAQSLKTNFESQKMTTSLRFSECTLDGEKSRCALLGVQGAGEDEAMIAVLGVRKYSETENARITCMTHALDALQPPAPCEQVMQLVKAAKK